MGRKINRLSGLEIDEVSLVDRPANQYGKVAIAKRQEDVMAVYDASGVEVDEGELEPGDFVYDETGNEFVFLVDESDDSVEGDEAYDNDQEQELQQAVGKNGAPVSKRRTASASLGDQVMESLSKAFTDEDRNEVIAKAMDTIQEVSKRNEELEDVVAGILEDREASGFSELAKSYDLPVDPEEIAGIMHRASQTLPQQDLETLDRLFSSMGTINKAYFDEIGYSGTYEGSALSEVFAAAGEVVVKSGSSLSQEQAVTALFSANPDAYDAYEADQRNNR
jgi:hypothetical protein